MKKSKKVLRIIAIVFLLILIGITSFFGYYFYNMKGIDLKAGALTMNEKSALAYHVKLKNSDYYKKESTSYLTDFIDEITASYNYSTTFSHKVKGEYSYYVEGTLRTSVENENQGILNRDIYKSEVKKKEIEGNILNISDDFLIDVEQYKKMYDELVSNYHLNLKGDLFFHVVITYNVFDEQISKSVNQKAELTLEFPIDGETTTIKTSPEKENVFREYKESPSEHDSIYFVIALEFFGAGFLFSLIILLLVIEVAHTDTEYEKIIHHYLKKYDSLIVELKSLPNLADIEVLFVKTFDDLVDAANQLSLPINYINITKKHESIFLVILDEQCYAYKIREK